MAPSIEFLHGISGTRDGIPYPPKGGTLEVSEAEAESLIFGGYAKAVAEVTADESANPGATTSETATADTTGVETAAVSDDGEKETPAIDWSALASKETRKVSELQEELAALKLDTNGTKPELLERLTKATSQAGE